MSSNKIVGIFEDRFKHPILGAFVFSWLLVNYEFVINISSLSLSSGEKIKLIQSSEFSYALPMFFGMLYPILITVSDLFLQVLKTLSINIKSTIRKNLKETDINQRYEKDIEKLRISNKRVKTELSSLKEIITDILSQAEFLKKVSGELNNQFNTKDYNAVKNQLNSLTVQIDALNSTSILYEFKELEVLLESMELK